MGILPFFRKKIFEKIELEMHSNPVIDPVDDGGMDDGCDDLPLLRHIRRSVWDD